MAGRADQLIEQALASVAAKGLANQSALQVLQAPTTSKGQANLCKLSVLYDMASKGQADSVRMEVLYDVASKGVADELRSDVLAEPPTKAIANLLALQVLWGLDELSPTAPLYIPMSNYLFPSLPGLGWSVHKKPKFQTTISQHLSGREVRVSNYAYPIWQWDMTYEFLRSGTEAELQTLMGFYLARAGSFDTFLYKDPGENNVMSGVAVGTGDGGLTKWTLTKTYGGFTEPCGYVDPATLQVYKAGILQVQGTDYSFVSPNQIVFASPPAAGAAITANFTWYYRVRFADDSQDYENFMFNLWSLKKVSIISVKP